MKRRYKKILKLVKRLNKLCSLDYRLDTYYPEPSELTISLTITEEENWKEDFFNKMKELLESERKEETIRGRKVCIKQLLKEN